MNERIKFIARYLEAEDSFTELCSRFGISRKTGYKWVERYEDEGAEGLEDRRRGAHSPHPNATSPEVVAAIVKARKKHPRWGPKKLLVVLRRRHPTMPLPATSTVGEILKREGLIRPRKRRRRSAPYPDGLGDYQRANAIWCADFKGHFAVGKGERCHPLTISDGYSRYLLCCRGLRRPLHSHSQRVFERVFREFGLPDAIRTDNGPPFSTLAPAGLSRLAVWWIRLGIRHERIEPGRPDQNGRHERMHGTLKAETARPPRSSFRAQQRAFDRFREEYNRVRPHEALNMDTPAEHYEPSLRKLPKILPEPNYPSHFETAIVYPNGIISFEGIQWYLSLCLKGELVGIEDVGNDCFKVHFAQTELGLLDFRNHQRRGYRSFGTLLRTDGEQTGKRRKRKLRRR